MNLMQADHLSKKLGNFQLNDNSRLNHYDESLAVTDPTIEELMYFMRRDA